MADEDPAVVAFVMKTLREDGHAVFHAYDVLAATQLAFALEPCDLVISNTKVEGVDGLANMGRSTPEAEAHLPPDVPILREPFTAQELRAAVAALLDGKRKIYERSDDCRRPSSSSRSRVASPAGVNGF